MFNEKDFLIEGSNYIRLSIKYDLGGYNYFTYKKKERGYYIHVSPIEKTKDYMITYKGFSGFYHMISTVGRRSNKANREAIANTLEHFYIVDQMVKNIFINEGFNNSHIERILKEMRSSLSQSLEVK